MIKHCYYLCLIEEETEAQREFPGSRSLRKWAEPKQGSLHSLCSCSPPSPLSFSDPSSYRNPKCLFSSEMASETQFHFHPLYTLQPGWEWEVRRPNSADQGGRTSLFLEINYEKARTLESLARAQTLVAHTFLHSRAQEIPFVFLPSLTLLSLLGITFSLPLPPQSSGSEPEPWGQTCSTPGMTGIC